MQKPVTVSQINAYIKASLDSDALLRDIWIEGEISNYKPHYSGHIYLTLKDGFSAIKAVMFKGSAASLDFCPENGMRVQAHGRVSVFERDGVYQLYIDRMRKDGVGDLYAAFEELKKKLEREGLFDAEKKKPIPRFPKIIGIVTSATGAAVRDIINIVKRRFKACDIYVYPVLVQGAGASAEIAGAIKYFNENKAADVLIVGRGGGSAEDLWAFNEETTVRAVAGSEIPVISAVGHETDFTLCDFAADMRAPTPSAAAELAVPDMVGLLSALEKLTARMTSSFSGILNLKEQELKKAEAEFGAKRFAVNIENKFTELDDRYESLKKCSEEIFENYDTTLSRYAASLDALSPMKILGRGYGVVLGEDKKALTDSKQVSEGDKISVILSKGSLECTVDEVNG